MLKQALIDELQAIPRNSEVYLVLPNGLRVKLHSVSVEQEIQLHPVITTVYNNTEPQPKEQHHGET